MKKEAKEKRLQQKKTSYLTALATHASISTGIADVDAALALTGRRVATRGIDDALLDVGRKRVKGLVDVDVALGRHLQERDAQLIGQRLSLLRRDRPLLFPVALVADQDLVNALRRVLLYVREPSPYVCSSQRLPPCAHLS